MKMHAMIVKEDFAVMVAFCNISLFKNPVITIFKVVGCEECVRGNKLPLWGQSSSRCAILANFFEKKAILTFAHF